MEVSENVYANTTTIVQNGPRLPQHRENCADVYANEHIDSTQRKDKPSMNDSGSQSSGVKCYRLAVVCLGLLCVLLLAVTAVLCVRYSKLLEERQQLGVSTKNLTSERDQLQTTNNNLQKQLSECGKFCLSGWTKFGCRCYYISSQEKNWADSRHHCREMEADLVTIRTKEEQEALANLKIQAWIGLTDEDTEGVWTWVDGTALTSAYWHAGEPNNSGGGENCAEIIGSLSNPLEDWNDISCSASKKYVCKK